MPDHNTLCVDPPGYTEPVENSTEPSIARPKLTALDVLKAIWVHRQGAAMLTELEIVDEEVQAEHDRINEWAFRLQRTHQGPPPPRSAESLCRRVDVLLVDGDTRTAIEVKVTRYDWLRETEAKRRAWRSVTHRFVYACPEGLIRPEEVPQGIGLWYVTPKENPPSWDRSPFTLTIAKKASRNKQALPLPQKVVINICHRASAKLVSDLSLEDAP